MFRKITGFLLKAGFSSLLEQFWNNLQEKER